MRVDLDLSKVEDYYTRAVFRQVVSAFKEVPDYSPDVADTPWNKFTVRVPPTGAFVVCDTIPINKFISLKYIITIVSKDQARSRSLEMTVMNKKTEVLEQVYNVMGDGFEYDITTRINGNLSETVFKNLEDSDLRVIFARIIL